MNSAQMIGTLLNNPEIAWTSGEKPLAICKVMIRTLKAYDKQTQLNVPITFFGQRAESFSAHATKGALVYIECAISSRERPGKNGGTFYNVELTGQHWVIQPEQGMIRPQASQQQGVPAYDRDVPDFFDPQSIPF